ncbi:hypothetical protein QFC24_004738 [Naganishia onofrii]|uniref:Uncharacterized protein n=1 Tax=Naganishia onofrii TaxID=1851511 RepID=A0ACC2XCS3_9TREE|nr:hypothetical protein QFC24_004738 [Naganishia onofrii]
MSEQVEFPKIEYCIFDMDGLLSRSEYEVLQYEANHRLNLEQRLQCEHSLRVPLSPVTDRNLDLPTDMRLATPRCRIYTIVTNEILLRYGYHYSWEIKSGVMGKVQREAVQYIYDHCPGLSDKLSIEDFLEERNRKQDELFAKVQPMEGAVEIIKHLHKHGIPIALATGSHDIAFKVKTVRRKVGNTEEPASEEERIERSRGLVFEDAVPGLRAGVRAGMNVVWVPDPSLRALNPKETYGAKVIVESLKDFRPEQWGLPPME